MEDRGSQPETAAPPKSRSVADRVAARYAKAPTYSELLAAEARNVARAAEAAAIAAGDARNAAQALLVGLDVDLHDPEIDSRPAEATPSPELRAHRLSHSPGSLAPLPRQQPTIVEATDEEEEIEDEAAYQVQPLPAKLLEFPRELVAARKARPRLAEGPLREDPTDGRPQLRIFEVEPETISTDPAVGPVLPEWSAIRLDSHPDPRLAVPQSRNLHPTAGGSHSAHRAGPNSSPGFDLPLQTASLEDRLMAGIVDAALIVAGFLVFILVFVACTAHPPMGRPALAAAGVALLGFAVIYQLLFFNFGSDTPGMRYAKIALCTFDDENPTRKAKRRRLGALLLSVSPMGLGILWAFFDDDRLGWHDRISHTYQRSYR